MKHNFFQHLLISGFLAVLFFLWQFSPVAAQDSGSATLTPAERDQLTQQLNQLEQEAAALDQNIQDLQSQALTLKNQIKILNDQIKQRELEVRRLTLVIRQTNIDIAAKVKNIATTSGKIKTSDDELSASVREFAEQDRDNLLTIMLKNDNLSEFFLALNNLERIQKHIQETLSSLKEYKVALEQQKADLEEFREGQEEAKTIQVLEQQALADKKKERDKLLADTQGKESVFQNLLKKKKADIAALRAKLSYLEEAGITAEEALKYAKLAAQRTGIRTAFLLGLLEVETGRQFENQQITVGSNLGTGNWRTDMYQCYIELGKPQTAETQKNAFLQITAELALDPDKVPVSRKPNYGCGGAMGPAQFIPTTWLRLRDRVAALVGKALASPWSVDDSFTAAALFLADAGASSQKKSGEIAAARIYISGNANCPSRGSARYACLSYANRVYSLSQDIEAIL